MLRILVLQIILGSVYGGVVTDLNKAIFNGEDADEGEFPFMASFRSQLNGHSCGATILTKDWVMTAAHCCDRRTINTMLINVGSIYVDHGGANHSLSKIIMHKDYDPYNYYTNDICVIHLKEPLTFDENVQPVTLAAKNFKVNEGDALTAVGWGWYKPHELPERLQKAETFVGMTNEECGKILNFTASPGHICAKGGKEGQSVCYGDSGGPLLRKDVQVGIASFGKPPCQYPLPGVFARTPHYVDWIKEQLGDDAGDLKFSD